MQKINPGLFTTNTNEWGTPDSVFKYLDNLFGPFDLDPAASDELHVCKDYYTIKDNGLKQSWANKRVFLNPPYGNEIPFWMRACCEKRKETLAICALIPARVDTKWFHKYVLHRANDILLVAGRIKFKGAFSSAPFPSLVIFYDPLEPLQSRINSIAFK